MEEGAYRLSAQAQILKSLNYTNVLARGFAMVRTDQGNLVTSAGKAAAVSRLHIAFHDGEVEVTTGTQPAAVKKTKANIGDGGSGGQSTLF